MTDIQFSKWPPGIPVEVSKLFIRFCREVREKGIERYSADAILHRIRWHMTVERGDRTFKCNNNWTPVLARWAMAEFPLYRGLFELRATHKERENV